jgi:hypothetical protein
MKPHKQTSPAISSIAAKYVRIRKAKFYDLAYGIVAKTHDDAAEQFLRDIRKLAASALSQDQTKGQK